MIFKTIIGSAAEGDFYFPRPHLNIRLKKYLDTNSNVLLSAPRRVGKTSFLKNLKNDQWSGYFIKYHNTESINSSNEFFKRLYKSLLEELSTHQSIWKNIGDTLKRNRIEKIGGDGIELKGVNLDYYEELKQLLKKVNYGDKLVFIIDEFSETVENIINDHGESLGKNFLHQNRELRQDKDLSKKMQFIYCGSIGLGNIAERIGATKTINDLTDFPIPAFSEEEALAMISEVTVLPELIFEKKTQKYLLDRMSWLMPYYIQIILDEVETILLQNGSKREVAEEIIDQAINLALDKRNYFEHWHNRLRTAFKGEEYTFTKEVLNVISKSESGASKIEIFDLTAKYELGEEHGIILRTLEYDGYINLNAENNFTFNSPLLKIWWERNIAI